MIQEKIIQAIWEEDGILRRKVSDLSWSFRRPLFVQCLFCAWASLVARLIIKKKKSSCNAGDLGWEDPLEKGKATHSSILAWRIHGLYSPWNRKESDVTE